MGADPEGGTKTEVAAAPSTQGEADRSDNPGSDGRTGPSRLPPTRRSRLFKLALLAGGLGLAAYLAKATPHEQHLRFVLGNGAPDVTGVAIQYVSPEGEIAREATLRYPEGGAPRVISHEPSLPDGDYRVRIELDTREGRRSVESRVTLGGGSTQVDVTHVLTTKP